MDDGREEILFHRVLEGTASPEEWIQLEVRAQADPSLWERLGHTFRVESRLAGELSQALRVADGVELPRPAGIGWRSPGVGWAAALLVGALWVGTALVGRDLSTEPSTLLVEASPLDTVLDEYVTRGIEQGRVIASLPRITLDARPTEDGRLLEVLFLRRLLEREVVDHAYELEQDEHGVSVAVPVNWASALSSEPF